MARSLRRPLITITSLATLLLAGEAAANTRWHDGYSPSKGGWNLSHHVRTTGDVDGDGRADLVGFGDAGVYVARSKGAGFAPVEAWTADFTAQNGGWSVTDHPRMTGDFDGDGKDDLLAFGHYGALVARSTGSGFAPAQMWLESFGYLHGWRVQHVRRVGDVNGDGKDDIVGFGQDSVQVALSTGTSFAAPVAWSSEFVPGNGGWSATRNPRHVADVNGDGLADIVGFAEWGTLVALSTGSSFAPLQPWLVDFSPAQGWMSDAEYPRVLADVDGDGLADVVGFGYHGALVARSHGAGFSAGELVARDFSVATGWTSQHPRGAADVDGDGLADLVGFAQDGVRVLLGGDEGFADQFSSFAGRDHVSRLRSVAQGTCTITTPEAYVRHVPCDGQATGWAFEAQQDGSYLIKQDGKCLFAHDTGAPVEHVLASTVGCSYGGRGWRLERTTEGRFRVRNADNDQCLNLEVDAPLDGNRLNTRACDARAHEMWDLDTLRARTLTSKLQAGHSGRCVYAPADSAAVVQWDCQDAPTQDLLFTDHGDGSFMISSRHDGRCLTVAGASTEAGAAIIQSECNAGARHQRWALDRVDDTHVALVSLASGHCLDVHDNEQHNGAGLIQWPCHLESNQQWTLLDVRSTAAMTISLQQIGDAAGTALVIGGESGGYLTRDPRAIVHAMRQSGAEVDAATLEQVLSPAQRQELFSCGWSWQDELPPDVQATFRMFTVRADAELSLGGVTVGTSAEVNPGELMIGGQLRADFRHVNAEVDVSLSLEGIEISRIGGGFDTPVASGSISYAFDEIPTSFSLNVWAGSQLGINVTLGGFHLDFRLDTEALAPVAVVVEVPLELVDDAQEVFGDAASWSAHAWGTVISGLSDGIDEIGDFFDDLFDW